jgi:2'-5' RNA ligase
VTTPDGTPATLRLFTALWPPASLRDALASLRDRWQWPAGAAPVASERLHVTLHFIGQVPAARLAEVGNGLAVEMDAADLRLDAARQQVWPGGIAVLEFDAPEALRTLHARLANALAALQLPLESRPWRPHVTFARKARGAKPPQPDAVVLPGWKVDSYTLVRTVPGRGYETLQRYAAAKG